jgi:hypothetical protein|tara:strand:+ start:1359 stop:1820 length:462 start_codon:yes stop_codon:yes gene_type:complete
MTDITDITAAQNSLIQVILANTSSAMKISNTLCDHSQDKVLKADEIIGGLIYRLMIPMTDEEITESMASAEALMYDDSEDEDEGDIEENDFIVDDRDDLLITRTVRTNQCNCDICSQVRVCLCNFKDYVPKDELGDKFKRSIIDTCRAHNRII